MDKIGPVGRMSDMEFMIHVLDNLPDEYDAVLDSLESHLVSTEKIDRHLKLSERS